MADLIEVAELDTGKRELNLEHLRPLPMLREARDRYCDEAREKHIRDRDHAPTPISRLCRPTAARCARSSTICCPTQFATRPKDGEILLAAEEIEETSCNSRCATLAAALKPSG